MRGCCRTLNQLATTTHTFPLAQETLKSVRLLPRKDPSAERIEAGMLQLPSGTVLVVDETALQPGQLQEAAVRNIQALAMLSRSQLIEVDFLYYSKEFPVDIILCVVSEGRSFLPVRPMRLSWLHLSVGVGVADGCLR